MKNVNSLRSQRTLARAHTILMVIGLFFTLSFGKLLTIMLRDNNANGRSISLAGAQKRGRILDRAGNVLALSLPVASLSVNPLRVKNVEELSEKIHLVLPHLSVSNIKNKLSKKTSFAWLQRHLTPQQHQGVLSIGDPALGITFENKRFYPKGELFSHIVGFTNVDNVGLEGVERKADKTLQSGEDCNLSISSAYQEILREELLRGMRHYDAKGAAGSVMNIKTGEVLALTSLPDFHPNELQKEPQKYSYNKIFQANYEPGSVFKIATAAMALESHKISPLDIVDVTKPIRIGRYEIRDYYPSDEPLIFEDVFVKSSNIGTAKIALKVGRDFQQEFYKKIGLDSPLVNDFFDTVKPRYPTRWGDTTSITASYGYGFSLSPIHLMSIVGTLLNGGEKIMPTIVNSYGNNKENKPIISPRSSKMLCNILNKTLNNGASRHAQVKGYLVGGKTGTSEIATKGGYNKKENVTSFVGVFPIDNPQYILYVCFDRPRGNEKTFGKASAGWNAAPVAGRIMSRLLPQLGVSPNNH